MVPPHRRDRVSPEKLQPLQRVESGCSVTCWKKQKRWEKSIVLRNLRPKRKKMEQPLMGKINTLTEKKNFYVVKNNTHKIRGLHRVKVKT